jgi:hypothetical protein
MSNINNLNLKDLVQDKSYATEDEMKKDPNAIYVDPESAPAGIIDLEKLTIELVSFLEYLNTSQMEELEKQDHDAFIKHLEAKYEDFTLNYYSIFKLLTEKGGDRDVNIGKLLNLIEILKQVQNGESDMDSSYENFREKLNSEFIYSKYGGKKKFEEHMAKNKKNKKKNK